MALDGKSTREIAREVRLSYGTVWNIVNREQQAIRNSTQEIVIPAEES